MEQIVNLLWVLICICYLGVGFVNLLTFVLWVDMANITDEIKKRKKKERNISFRLKFTLVFLWPIVLIACLFSVREEN